MLSFEYPAGLLTEPDAAPVDDVLDPSKPLAVLRVDQTRLGSLTIIPIFRPPPGENAADIGIGAFFISICEFNTQQALRILYIQYPIVNF